MAQKEQERMTVTVQKIQATAKEKKRLERISEYVAWLIRLPTCFEGNQVAEEEWHDNLLLRYRLQPIHFP